MPRVINPVSLYDHALHYLERYAASAQSVRQVLQRGLRRAARQGEEIPEDAADMIEAVLAKLAANKLINDAEFAAMKVRSLRRSGASAQKVRQKLMQKGVAPVLVERALESEEVGDDRHAIVTYARKKRLGPYAVTANPDKHLMALARAGFSLSLARWVIGGASVEELEAALETDR